MQAADGDLAYEREKAALLVQRRQLARRRYIARAYDIMLFSLVIGGSVASAGLSIYPALLQHSAWMLIVLTACMVPFEAGLISNFGTTPGKHAVGLSVVHPTGEMLTMGEALTRSWNAGLRGQAFRIALISDWCMWRNYKRFCSTGATSWDHLAQVRAKELSGLTLVGYRLGCVLFLGPAVLALVAVVFLIAAFVFFLLASLSAH